MESINIKSDIKQFVDDNATGKVISNQESLPLFEFVPYSGSHPSFKNLGNNPPMATVSFPIDPQDGVMNTVKRWMERVIPQQQIDDIRQVLDSLMDKSWRGEELDTAERATISMLIRERIGRKSLVWVLNQRRTAGILVLNQAGFRNIGEIMNEILTECVRTRDVPTGKSIIVLSQTFHREREDPSESRVYLHSLIVDHELWKDLTYWEEIIIQAIEEDFKMHEEYGIGDYEEEAEQVKRLKNIVFCQLGSYSHIMMTYNIDTKFVAELVSKYACRYDLSSSDMETLLVRFTQATVNKTNSKKPETEIVTQVQRGIPKWIEDLHGSTAYIANKIKPREVPIAQLSSPELKLDSSPVPDLSESTDAKPDLIDPESSS